MTIECPRCGTLYRRPRAGRGASYRCARCRHVFDARGDEPAMVADEVRDEPRFTLGDDEPDVPAEADDVAEPVRDTREEPPAAGGTMSGTARFAVRSLAVVALGYAVLSIYLYTHVDATRDWLRRIPLIGSRLSESRLQTATVQLMGVEGRYERVQGDRLVFIISGTAVNASPLPVRGIQVEGRILGAQEQRQVVYCGAAPRDVQDLSLREIALLQTLEPPKEWTLPPSDQTGFLVVFPQPPADLREFGAEVVAVQAPPRRGAAVS
ncbi:MAG TPA: hypothetical protein VKU61_09755 [Candidatus Binatia bacterium]|nr:hypothetical protein [Candidatus Binatia bacterium]